MTSWRSLWGPRETTVSCPSCSQGKLLVHISCLAVSVGCTGCSRKFELRELAGALEESEFAILAEAVGDRFSDRV